jgi:hypothetical protein
MWTFQQACFSLIKIAEIRDVHQRGTSRAEFLFKCFQEHKQNQTGPYMAFRRYPPEQ